MTVRRFQRFETTGKLASYLHGNRIGVIVDFDGADEQVGKDVAMHIAAMKPVSLSSDQVPAELIEKERSVAQLKAQEDADKATAEGKQPQSAEIVAKRIDGSVQKYLKEVSLFNQAFVKNDKQSDRADAEGQQRHREGVHDVRRRRRHREESRRLRSRSRGPDGCSQAVK
jgi:elongation factor Ts